MHPSNRPIRRPRGSATIKGPAGKRIATAMLCAVAYAVMGVNGDLLGQAGSAALGAEASQTGSALGNTFDFHIKPQPLATALKQFSAETKLRLAYAEADIRGKTTPGIDGNYSAFESLTRLLAGTALAFRQSGKDILISAPEGASGKQAALVGASPRLKAAWDKFQSAVDHARAETEQTALFQDEPANRAKAYHALMEAQAMAYNFAIAPRLDYPRIQEATGWQLNTYTLGQNGPDSLYGNIFLDGHQTYKITGRAGDVRLTLFQVFSHVIGRPEGKLLGNYDLSDFKSKPDGSFDILLSATKQEGNWIQLDPNSSDNWIMIRRWVADWNNDPGQLKIEMVSKPEPGHYDYDEFSEDAIAARIESAADVLKYIVESWNIGLYQMYLNASGGEKNHLALLPGTATSQFGSPTSHYANGVFSVKDDEALIVELDDVPTDAAYWSFQLGDAWSRSLDFMNRQTSINMAEASIDGDGKFFAVISRTDPGIANWLDTTGRQDGTIVFRNYRSKTSPVPVIRKVPFADIWKYLPPNTKRVTPEERARNIDHRRQGLTKTYGGVF